MAKDNWGTKKKAAKKVAKKTPARKKAAKKAPAKKKAAKKVAKKTPARKKAAKKAPAKKKALTHAERENSYIASLPTHERMLRKAIQSIEEDNWLNDPMVRVLGEIAHGEEPSVFDDRAVKRQRRYLNFKRMYLSIQIQALRAVYDNDVNEEKMLKELDFNEAMSPYRDPNPYVSKDKVIDRFLAQIDSWFNCDRPRKIYESQE